MATATAIQGGVGTAIGVAKFFEGRKLQRRGTELIENFQYQDLQAFSESERVSTLGADLQREEAARTTATSVDALRSGGTRALVGGLGRVQNQNNLLSRQIGADLDRQQIGINTRIAQQRTQNQAVVEQRDQQRLAGFGQLANIGFQTAHKGLADIVNGIGTFGKGVAGAEGNEGSGGNFFTENAGTFGQQSGTGFTPSLAGITG